MWYLRLSFSELKKKKKQKQDQKINSPPPEKQHTKPFFLNFLAFIIGRKAMTSLDSILKSRDIILPTKVHLVKAMVFPVVMYGYESWTLKKAEHRKIDDFELWCWRRFDSPLDFKEIQPVHPKGNQFLNIHWKD